MSRPCQMMDPIECNTNLYAFNAMLNLIVGYTGSRTYRDGGAWF